MKKLLSLFLIFGIIFPSFSFSAGTYKVVKTKEDPETGKEEVEYEFEVEYDGLIPCGKCLNVKSGNPEYQPAELQRCGANKKFIPCQICHIFILISEVIKFFYSQLLWPLLGVLITILGFLLLLSEIHPIVFTGQGNVFFAIEKIKEGIKLTAFSFFFLLALWFLLNCFFTVMGVAEWTGLKNWFRISCTIKELPLGPLAEEAGLPPTVLGCPINGGEITSHFGEPRSYEIHPGVDIKPTTNDWRVFAVDSGEIIYVGCRRGSCQEGCGYEVVIKHDNGYTTRYCHLNPQKTSEILDNKKRVERGDPIGIIDNTGNSHGNHLHFEVKDPQGRLQPPENFIAHCDYPEKPGIWKPTK